MANEQAVETGKVAAPAKAKPVQPRGETVFFVTEPFTQCGESYQTFDTVPLAVAESWEDVAEGTLSRRCENGFGRLINSARIEEAKARWKREKAERTPGKAMSGLN